MTIPRHGYRFIAKVTTAEQNAAIAPTPPATPVPVAANPPGRERTWQLVAGLAGVLLVVWLAWIAFHPRNDTAPPAMVRFQIPAPEKLMFLPWDSVDVSPDGQRIVFTAGNLIDANDRLFVRPLDGLATTEIRVPNIDIHNPFWSPDGRQIAFMSYTRMYKVDVSGGPPVTICSDCKASSSGGTWNRDGVILFSPLTSNIDMVVSRISAAGGEAKPLRSLAPGETIQAWPQFRPDGKHYLYLSLSNASYQQGIYAASLDSNDRKFLVATENNATYSQGQLLFTRGDRLIAQPLDVRSLKLSGEPRPVADHIQILTPIPAKLLPSATFAASPNGVIVWRHAVNTSMSSLQWLDRTGKKLDTIGGPGQYHGFALSPDESKVAVTILESTKANKPANLWILDLHSHGTARLTIDPAHDIFPVWSPDGSRIAFTSDRSGQRALYWKLIDDSQPEQLLLAAKDPKQEENPEDWSRDGKYLVYNTGGGQGPAHINVLPLADRKPVPLVEGNSTSHDSQISPNGRWIAYMSREVGLPEVFVESFDLDPSRPRGKWQVSSRATGGGAQPRWRRDGKELYYHSGDEYFAVDVKTDGPTFSAGVPKLLFQATTSGDVGGHQGPYAVSSDGQRFLILAAIEDHAPIEVLANWR